MLNKKNKAFTFIEVVIIVWIIIIIATIAILSFFSYIWTAKNTKRISDLNNIKNYIEISVSKWINMNAFIYGNSSTITWSNISISWNDNYSDVSKYYLAWDINYKNLWFDENDFLDPDMKKSYKIWYNSLSSSYEIAATVSNLSDYNSLVFWNWKPRTKESTKIWIKNINWNKVFLSWTNNLFRKWDIVIIWWDEYKVKTSLINTIHLYKNVTNNWADVILKNSESIHIIKSWSINEPIKDNSDYKYTPYYY